MVYIIPFSCRRCSIWAKRLLCIRRRSLRRCTDVIHHATATDTDGQAVCNRSSLFGSHAKPDMNMFTTTKSIYHTKLMKDNTEADVVVAAAGNVGVPIRNAAVLRAVDPAATALHALGARAGTFGVVVVVL